MGDDEDDHEAEHQAMLPRGDYSSSSRGGDQQSSSRRPIYIAAAIVLVIAVISLSVTMTARAPPVQQITLPALTNPRTLTRFAWTHDDLHWSFTVNYDALLRLQLWRDGTLLGTLLYSPRQEWSNYTLHSTGDCYRLSVDALHWRGLFSRWLQNPRHPLPINLPVSWQLVHPRQTAASTHLNLMREGEACHLADTHIKPLRTLDITGADDGTHSSPLLGDLNISVVMAKWARRSIALHTQQADTRNLDLNHVGNLVERMAVGFLDAESGSSSRLWRCHEHPWSGSLELICRDNDPQRVAACGVNSVESRETPTGVTRFSPLFSGRCQCAQDAVARIVDRVTLSCGPCTITRTSGCTCWADHFFVASAVMHSSCWDARSSCVEGHITVPCDRTLHLCQNAFASSCSTHFGLCHVPLRGTCSEYHSTVDGFVFIETLD